MFFKAILMRQKLLWLLTVPHKTQRCFMLKELVICLILKRTGQNLLLDKVGWFN